LSKGRKTENTNKIKVVVRKGKKGASKEAEASLLLANIYGCQRLQNVHGERVVCTVL